MNKPELVVPDVAKDAPKLPVRVRIAHLQAGITVEGHTSSDTNLNPQKFPKLKMSLTVQGLVLDFGDGKLTIVPTTNVKAMQLG